MSMVATDFKELFSIAIKSRHDSITDQYNRIFMLKLCLISSIVMGISWYQDSIHCIVPDHHKIDKGFVSATCWIQGVYVYKELSHRVDEVAYFGMPYDMNNDGILPKTQELCTTEQRLTNKVNKACVPMQKTFFLQYQYMPFLICVFGLVYYLPYLFFKMVNADLISLKEAVKEDEPDSEKIAKHYFSARNAERNNKLRIVFNIIVKLMYLGSNLVMFLGLDSLLNGEFIDYGNKWIDWSKTDNSVAYDYMGLRDHPKPGNLLLPPFGYCELFESSKDVKQTIGNKHKFVCELSQNILYQYALIVLWFAIIFGIVMSVIGIIILIGKYLTGYFGFKATNAASQHFWDSLTLREKEYLEYIRKKKITVLGEVIEKLKEKYQLRNSTGNGLDNDKAPLYRRSSIEKTDDL